MRAAIAILLAGLLVWIQAATAVCPVVHTESATCCCCDCGKRDCCNSQAPSNPQPPPTATVRLTEQAEQKLLKPAVAESRTASVTPVRKTSPSPVAQRAPALPLFHRHCALLI